MKKYIAENPIAFQMKTFIGLVIFVITTVAGTAGLYYNLASSIQATTLVSIENKKEIKKFSEKTNKLEQTNYQIQTDLQWIKTTLTKMESRMK